MSGVSTTISTQMKLTVGLSVVGWSLVSQQALAATVYAVLNSYSGRVRYFPGYVQEYILWRLRDPTLAPSKGVIIANVAAATVVILVVLLAWRWIT